MLEQLIKEKAYHIWEAEGFPEGRAEAHWEQAKRALSYSEPSATAVEKPVSRKRASTPRAKKAKI